MKAKLNAIVAFNAYYLAKQNNLQIGRVEEACGVRTGYFSRLKMGKSQGMSLDVAYKLAQLFDVSLDDLVTDMRYETLKKEADALGYALVDKGELEALVDAAQFEAFCDGIAEREALDGMDKN